MTFGDAQIGYKRRKPFCNLQVSLEYHCLLVVAIGTIANSCFHNAKDISRCAHTVFRADDIRCSADSSKKASSDASHSSCTDDAHQRR